MKKESKQGKKKEKVCHLHIKKKLIHYLVTHQIMVFFW